MNGDFFLDTNIFIYSLDPKHPAKRATARELIQAALSSRRGVISWQVVQECVHVLRKKCDVAMTPEHCRMYLDEVLLPLCAVHSSREVHRHAFDLHERQGISFHDALIVAAAYEAGCDRLLTEDMQHGQKVAGLTIVNPFLAATR